LAACGGGSDDGPNSGANPGGPIYENPGPGTGSGSIENLTTENAGLVAFAALTNVKSYAMSLQLQGATQLLLAGFTLALADLNGQGYTQTDPCDTSGSTTWTFTDADNDQNLSQNDSWVFMQDQCVKNGDVSNGSWTINFLQFDSDNSTPADSDALEFITDLTGTSFGDAYTFRGTYAWISDTPDGIVKTQTISSDSIVTTLNYQSDSTLSDFFYSSINDDSSQAETIEFRALISDAVLANYQVTTQMPLTGINLPLLGGSEMYYEGEFTVVLEQGSVNLVALSATDVRISVDLDGDGDIDQAFDSTWNALTQAYLQFVGFGI
jgi:hypothetical protein